MHAVHTIPAAFSLADCDRILAQAATATPKDAKLVGQTKDHNIRRADLVWLDNVPDTGWVMDAIIDLVRVANRDSYQFDLTEFMESLQVAHYDSAREGAFRLAQRHWRRPDCRETKTDTRGATLRI